MKQKLRKAETEWSSINIDQQNLKTRACNVDRCTPKECQHIVYVARNYCIFPITIFQNGSENDISLEKSLTPEAPAETDMRGHIVYYHPHYSHTTNKQIRGRRRRQKPGGSTYSFNINIYVCKKYSNSANNKY